MRGIDFKKASVGLTTYCLALLQNVPDDEQQNLQKAVALLEAEPLDEVIKVRILGLLLLSVVGPNVLTAAVEALRDELKPDPPQKSAAASS